MSGRRTFFFDGLGVSGGIAVGPAYVIESRGIQSESYTLSDDEVEKEVELFDQAVEMGREELRTIRGIVEEKIDRQQAAIFDAHLMMLEDPHLVDRTKDLIRREKTNAGAVFWGVTRDLGDQMKAIGDDYFADRSNDLYDVARRVLKFLAQLSSSDLETMPREGCIIVANDLGPAETAQFSREHVLGFCTNEGGSTSHTAIMAKALAIPAVVGLDFITHYVRSGDVLILDGSAGKVILNPSEEQVQFYKNKADEFEHLRLSLTELRDLPAVTTDGTRIRLYANIEFPHELDAADENGAEGIGLYRSEFLYLNGIQSRSESDHVAAYRMAFERMGDRPVVLRTLDIGGDKLATNEFTPHEPNPFMGLRAVRLCLARPEILRSQLQAMLAAGAGKELDIMIPMISSLDELRECRRYVDEEIEKRRRDGGEMPKTTRLGAMIEIPSAALQARTLAEEADFFSIGTNDLVQYTLAVDRINRSVAGIYRPTHPAVLHLIRGVVLAGEEKGVEVSVCGEMASDPRLAVLLIGLGVRKLSMGPSSIGVVKRAIRGVAVGDAEKLAQEVLSCSTASEVENTLHIRLGEFLNTARKPALS